MLTIDLKGKTALITGASSGVGWGVAKILARAGCNISGCATSKEDDEKAISFLEMIAKEGVEGIYTSCNVTEFSDLNHTVQKTMETYGGIDILVSNAGANFFDGAENCTEENWNSNMDLNLKSHWQLSRLCKPWLEKSRQGVILIMNSNHSEYTIPGCFPYNVAKTGLKGLVQSLAIEWGPDIRTVGIAPGFIDTIGNQKWFDSFPDPEKERQRTVDMHPVKKIGTSEEVGMFCAFLASDAASFISGTTYLMDGGRSAIMLT
jgi:NAD(P)-dependent dehydrogenase (short-subunit alcohol dehydrogenase family)